MLLIILENGHYALYDSKHGSPLTVALQNNCFESIHIINSGNFNFDYQMQDSQGQSFIGYLIRKMQDITDEQGEEFEKLADFSKGVFDGIKLDMHKA